MCHLGVGAALRFPLPPLALAGLTAYGLVALRWRVMNRYHTAAQVLVGGTYGAATALLFRGPARRLEAAVLPATIPLAWVLGIYAVGGVVVGSRLSGSQPSRCLQETLVRSVERSCS